MKISPVSTGGLPGATVGAATTARSNPERLEAAKAAFEGRTPDTMEFGDPKAALATQNVRAIKMRTNVSPDRHLFPTGEVDNSTMEQAPEGQNAISDANGQTQEGEEEQKPLSPQLAALARQKRALQLKEREIAAKEAELQAKMSGKDADSIAMEQLKSDPLGILQKAGVTYDQLTEAILSSGDPNHAAVQRIRELEAKIEGLEQGFDQKLSERDSQAERQALTEISREANRIMHEAGDRFEQVRLQNKQREVVDLIHRTWKQTGELMTTEEALEAVEDYLVDEALRIARSPKIMNRLTPQEAAQMQQQQRPQGMRTLTARDTATPPISRRERALAAFYGQLKK